MASGVAGIEDVHLFDPFASKAANGVLPTGGGNEKPSPTTGGPPDGVGLVHTGEQIFGVPLQPSAPLASKACKDPSMVSGWIETTLELPT